MLDSLVESTLVECFVVLNQSAVNSYFMFKVLSLEIYDHQSNEKKNKDDPILLFHDGL